MRGIRGHIINLSDGLGPPAGTVDVNAKVTAGGAELNNATHGTGKLNVVHLIGGSGSPTKADPDGHWGWDFELAPGQVTQLITPHDPQTEHRKRFPDESSQIGKAFFTDLERLGWAAGKDGLVWDAIQGGQGVSTWSGDPASTWGEGNWSIGAFGAGGDAGRVLVRRGIAFLGGVVFSIELADLMVPVEGQSLPSSNPSGSPRWDLLCLRIENDATSVNYGKQSFEILQGTPGAGLPAYPANPTGARRLPLHALSMAAGTSAYSNAYDLRQWVHSPPIIAPSSIVRNYGLEQIQTLGAGINDSILNTQMAANEAVISPACAWDGYVSWAGNPAWYAGTTRLSLITVVEGRDTPAGAVIAGTEYIPGWGLTTIVANYTTPGQEVTSFVFPIQRIPSYQQGRTWSRLRVRQQYNLEAGPAMNIVTHYVSLHLWPAR